MADDEKKKKFQHRKAVIVRLRAALSLLVLCLARGFIFPVRSTSVRADEGLAAAETPVRRFLCMNGTNVAEEVGSARMGRGARRAAELAGGRIRSVLAWGACVSEWFARVEDDEPKGYQRADFQFLL